MNHIETEELADIDYPAHPEEKMANSENHYDYITILVANLRRFYRERAHEVAVFGDIAWYPVRGNNEIWKAPDVMVCFGVPQRRERNRNSYAQHLEYGVAPSVVFEIDSDTNTEAEIEKKREWYEQYGVEEFYWLFTDPADARVFIREGNRLVEQTAFFQWTSPLLGIRLEWSTITLHMFNPDRTLMRPTEEHAAILEERARLAEEHAASLEKRAKLAEEQARLAEAQAKQEAQRAKFAQEQVKLAEEQIEQEAQARQLAEQRAEQEKQRAEQLAAMLRQLGVDPDNLPKS